MSVCRLPAWLHPVERWLMDLDILPIHSRIKHPQTQGKIERFHRTLEQELLRHFSFDKVEDVDAKLQPWREKYNHIRPHTALHMQCPGDVYVPSLRTYPTAIQPVQYGGGYHVVKVNSWDMCGLQTFKSISARLCEAHSLNFAPAIMTRFFSLATAILSSPSSAPFPVNCSAVLFFGLQMCKPCPYTHV